VRIAAQGEAALGAEDAAFGAQVREGCAERGIAGAQEIAKRVAGERFVSSGEGGHHAPGEIGDVLRKHERPGVNDAQMWRGREREREGAGLWGRRGAMLDGEAQRGVAPAEIEVRVAPGVEIA